MFSEGVKGKIKSRILFEKFFFHSMSIITYLWVKNSFFRILLETCMIDEIATDVEKKWEHI